MGASVAGGVYSLSACASTGWAMATCPAHAPPMWILLLLLLVVWAGLTVFGFLVEGLLWLAILGIVLFLATAVVGMLRGRAATKE